MREGSLHHPRLDAERSRAGWLSQWLCRDRRAAPCAASSEHWNPTKAQIAEGPRIADLCDNRGADQAGQRCEKLMDGQDGLRWPPARNQQGPG